MQHRISGSHPLLHIPSIHTYSPGGPIPNTTGPFEQGWMQFWRRPSTTRTAWQNLAPQGPKSTAFLGPCIQQSYTQGTQEKGPFSSALKALRGLSPHPQNKVCKNLRVPPCCRNYLSYFLGKGFSTLYMNTFSSGLSLFCKTAHCIAPHFLLTLK